MYEHTGEGWPAAAAGADVAELALAAGEDVA